MADDPTKYLPSLIMQNPSTVKGEGQQFINCVTEITERILSTFLQVLPSNYVSQIKGPFYTLQFQAAAEQLAKFFCNAQEVFFDADFNFTRPEYLYQILGSLVFPDAANGLPIIDGDISYREFLRRMVLLLLEGAREEIVKEGIELVTDAAIEIVVKGIAARDVPGSLWGLEDQFSYEINVISDDGTSFPADPFALLENIRLIVEALAPAHTLYEVRFLFKEVFEVLFEDSVTWNFQQFFYEDFRKYCLGAKEITGTAGETLTDRSLFNDPERDFRHVSPGATLEIESGLNAHKYRVAEVRYFPVGDDPTPRSYTTSPTGLTGTVTVEGEVLTDTAQDFGLAVENEILEILEGPNAGKYRLNILLGLGGGKVGFATGPSTQVIPSPCFLKIDQRMPVAATGQSYTVSVDRLGIQKPHTVDKEDVSIFFVL